MKPLESTLALNAGRAAQSPETGFVHRGDSIPIFENLCYALALFRSRSGDEIGAGKKLLERLFPFLTASGAFPHALHDYPTSSSASYRLLCALPLHWIFKEYHHVIEKALREKLQKILAGLLAISEQNLAPTYLSLLQAFRGEKLRPISVISSSEWGLLLLAYQLLDEKPTWILEGALQNWHPELMTYCGDPLQEYQRQDQPEITLFDLFMASYHRFLPERLKKNHPIHLQASLIFPFKQELSLRKHELLPPENIRMTNGFHHLRILWGSSEKIYSLVSQDSRHKYEKKDGVHLFTFPKEIPDEKNRMELTFYCSYLPDVFLTIDGEKATVFELGQAIEINTPEKKWVLQFNIEEGEGIFMGRISRGNRPSQIGLRGSQDLTSYDWKISIRTITRTPACKLSLSLL